MSTLVENIEIGGPIRERYDEVLTPAAVEFVARLHREFNSTRERLFGERVERQQHFDAGAARLPGRRPAPSETATGLSPRSQRPTSSGAGWRSPARPSAGC